MARKRATETPGADVLVVAVSDIHAGSTVALCPPRIELDDGGQYIASAAQLWLWQCWLDFWERVERSRTGELYVVLNGDLVEGDHHNTPQIMSRNPTAQAMAIDKILAVPLALGPDRIFIVRGTESHVGKSGSSEERIATGLRKDKRPVQPCPETGTDSWWHLRMDVQGLLFDFAHHGRTGHREHTRGNAANLYAHDILLAHVKDGVRPPDVCVRSHNHKWMDSGDAASVLRLFGLPAWQLMTAFGHRIATPALADIGGLLLHVRDGSSTPEKIDFQPQRGIVWRRR